MLRLYTGIYIRSFSYVKDADFQKILQSRTIDDNIYDLLREKGPTAVKCRFKTQLTVFSL